MKLQTKHFTQSCKPKRRWLNVKSDLLLGPIAKDFQLRKAMSVFSEETSRMVVNIKMMQSHITILTTYNRTSQFGNWEVECSLLFSKASERLILSRTQEFSCHQFLWISYKLPMTLWMNHFTWNFQLDLAYKFITWKVVAEENMNGCLVISFAGFSISDRTLGMPYPWQSHCRQDEKLRCWWDQSVP